MRNIKFFIFFFQFHLLNSLCTPSFHQCGCSYQQPILSKSRIVGGYTAREHSWPWIVSIRQMDIHHPGIAFCSGSILNEKYILTAAHCFYENNDYLISDYFIVIGAHYINDTNPIRMKIKSIILHENYDHDLFLNDIALLELSERINFNDRKNGFICLPRKNISTYPDESMNGIAIGWGRLGENSTVAYALQQVHLPIISNRDRFCIEQISDDLLQFCAGFIQGGKDACQGDSGGPLMVYDTNMSTWQIAGITSYGNGCARPENPGVYTRVSMFTDWIDQHVKRSSQASIKRISIQILLLSLCIVQCV